MNAKQCIQIEKVEMRLLKETDTKSRDTLQSRNEASERHRHYIEVGTLSCLCFCQPRSTRALLSGDGVSYLSTATFYVS